MDLDRELENLKQNPEKELDKMKSSSNSESANIPKDAPNVQQDAPNVGRHDSSSEANSPSNAPNIPSDAPNAGKPGKSGEKGGEKGYTKSSGEDKGNHEELLKFLDIVFSTLLDKLKLVFMMPYIFFNHYVKDYLSENSGNEQKIRNVQPAIIATGLVLALQMGLSFLTKDYSMIKILPVAIALIYCLMDSDKSKE